MSSEKPFMSVTLSTPLNATLPVTVRPYVEDRLPAGVNARYFSSGPEAFALAPDTDIGWFDMFNKEAMAKAISLATRMKWLNSVYAGVEAIPLTDLKTRGTLLTNGAGINAITIAEYVLMAMLGIAKGYRALVQAQDRHEWLADAPGRAELYESKALIVGFGSIGQEVAQRLKGFHMDITAVRRHPQQDGTATLGPQQWQSRLAEFDWVILAVPATPETDKLMGAQQFAAMKPSATLINVARGSVVDQDALLVALDHKQLGHAFLDVTEPEPLPPEHPLWAHPQVHISMHMSGRSQTRMFERAAARFLENLAHFKAGEPLTYRVNLDAGY